MKVNAATAHKMVGVSKPTFYKHVKEKPISTSTDENGALIVDISELIRVYGQDNLKTPEQIEQDAIKKKKSKTNSFQENMGFSLEEKIELEKLREKVSGFDAERKQLLDQIDTLKEHYDKSEEQRSKITALLTDQSKDGQKSENREQEQAQKLKELEQRLLDMQSTQEKLLSIHQEKKSWWPFSGKKTG